MIKEAIAKLVDRQDLSTEAMTTVMEHILSGNTTDAQIAAFAVAMRMKGETAEEIAAAAAVMRSRCTTIEVQRRPLVDTCGTGGDGRNTFNISTVSAIVVAACGVAVAKHGNRAVSSRAGSADVLQSLGVNIEIGVERVQACIESVGIGFLYAPAHHAAMRFAAPVRRELGLRTIFNLLGPLCNPAAASHQLVGVYDESRIEHMAKALGKLGVQGAWVVHGHGGLDEISTEGVTKVAELRDGNVTLKTVTPADFGLEPVGTDELAGGDADRNAAIARAILSGAKTPHRSAVLINAAAVLYICDAAKTLTGGVAMANNALDSGAANKTLQDWVLATEGVA